MLLSAHISPSSGIYNVVEKIEGLAELFFSDDITDEEVDENMHLILEVHRIWTGAGMHMVTEVLVQTGLAKSNREARDFVLGGAVRINGKKITSVRDAIFPPRQFIVRRGKLAEAVYLEVEDDRISEETDSTGSEGSHQADDAPQERQDGRHVESRKIRETSSEGDAETGRNQIPPESTGCLVPSQDRES